MAATYQAIGTALGSISSITTLAWPTHQIDDIGLLFVETANQAPGSTWPPTDWTVVNSIPNGTTNTSLYVCWQRATSSSMGNVTIADSGDHQYAVIMTVRGAKKTGSPIYAYIDESQTGLVDGATFNFSGSCTVSGSGLPAASEYLGILSASSHLDQTTAIFSNWVDYFSGGLTERFDAGTTVGNGGIMGIATKNLYNYTFINGNAAFTVSPGITPTDIHAYAIIIDPYVAPSGSSSFFSFF